MFYLTNLVGFGKTFACILGLADLCLNTIDMEPFSTSVFEGLLQIFAITT